MKIHLLLALLCAAVVREASGGWVDPATHSENYNISSYNDGRTHTLVFSDEFNTEGRDFHDGSDPRWTSLSKDDYTNLALHYYNGELVRTKNGFLNITTVIEDISFSYDDAKTSSKPGKKTKNYQSGMLQGWNKFCFTGGIVEISAQLPGDAHTGGLWPALWMLGNLARATFVGSSNNIWPWSYDVCSRGTLQHQQLFSRCNKLNHYNLHSEQGRGAPEIDILEAMPGKAILKNTKTNKPYYSASLQVAPGISNYRPNVGESPNKALWYDETYFKYGENTSQNIFFWGMHLEGTTKDRSYLADALSANRNIGHSQFNRQHIYRIEWVPGAKGFIQWHMDGKLVYRIDADALNITGAIIPEEPMYLLFNTAVSGTWGFPMPCPEGCACDCFDCRDHTCGCAVPAGMCSNFPASMLIDWVRVYQAEGDESQVVGCSTKTHPTKTFIEGHPSLYMDVGQSAPLQKIKHGGGVCSENAQCGWGSFDKGDGSPPMERPHPLNAQDDRLSFFAFGDGYISTFAEGAFRKTDVDVDEQQDVRFAVNKGACRRSKCECLTDDYTGPHCLAPNGHNDIDWDFEPPFAIAHMIIPQSLLLFVLLCAGLLGVVGGWKYLHERFIRAYDRGDTAEGTPLLQRDQYSQYTQ